MMTVAELPKERVRMTPRAIVCPAFLRLSSWEMSISFSIVF